MTISLANLTPPSDQIYERSCPRDRCNHRQYECKVAVHQYIPFEKMRLDVGNPRRENRTSQLDDGFRITQFSRHQTQQSNSFQHGWFIIQCVLRGEDATFGFHRNWRLLTRLDLQVQFSGTYFRQSCSSRNPRTSRVLRLDRGASYSSSSRRIGTPGQYFARNSWVGIVAVIVSLTALKT